MLRIFAFALLAQASQGLAPRAASTRRRWLAAAPGLLLLRPSEPAVAVTPGGEFCICNDKGCFGENCGGLKRPDVKYLGAATESYGQELSGASAALSGSRRGAQVLYVWPLEPAAVLSEASFIVADAELASRGYGTGRFGRPEEQEAWCRREPAAPRRRRARGQAL